MQEKDKIRFEKKYIKTTFCWNWKNEHAFTNSGYGMFYYHGGMRTSHRVSYELYVEEIPKGRWVLHKCDNRRCVNPEHLYLGDREQNTNDMISRGRLADTSKENNGRSKLTMHQVKRIREFKGVGCTCIELANIFGMSHQMISRICRMEAWN